MSHEEDQRLRKEAYKEAMREFLDDELKKHFTRLGEWVAHTFAILLLGACVWFILKSLGWTKGA